MSYYYLIIPGLCALFCVISGLFYRRHLPFSLWLLVAEGIISVSTDVASMYYYLYSDYIHNVFIFIDSILLIFASYSLIPKKLTRKFYPISVSIFCFSWFYSIYTSGFDHLANYSFAVSSFLITINYLFALYHNEMYTTENSKTPVRIICFALVVYHCGTFAFFCGLNYLLRDSIPAYIIDINTTLDSLKYFLIGLSFYLFKHYSKKKIVTNG